MTGIYKFFFFDFRYLAEPYRTEPNQTFFFEPNKALANLAMDDSPRPPPTGGYLNRQAAVSTAKLREVWKMTVATMQPRQDNKGPKDNKGPTSHTLGSGA